MKQLLVGLIMFYCSNHANAFSWKDLWFTPDQQGQSLMEKGQFTQAQQTFERSDWSAAAAYKAGDYQVAADLFKAIKTEQGYYNYANSQAHLGKYEEALKAYENALKINPKNKDAAFNRDLVKSLLKKDKNNHQNKKQQNKNKQNKDQQNKDKQNKDKQNKDKQNKDKQNKDQQNKDKQNKDQQNKDQQNKDQQNKDQQNKDQQNKDQQNKDQQNKDQQNKGQDSKKQQDLKKDPNKKEQKSQQSKEKSAADLEKQRAKEQWLRLIPDDPGGLMREKFLRDHIRRERGWYQ